VVEILQCGVYYFLLRIFVTGFYEGSVRGVRGAGCFREKSSQKCHGLNTNEIQIPHDKHHKVSSLVKSHQNTHNSVKYEVIYENVK